MALTDKLSAIGVAIREKTGKTALLTLDAMPAEILAITTGGGGSGDCNGMHIPDEALVITGDCTSRFADNSWNWFIETAGDKITTHDISKVQSMFEGSYDLTNIPFEIVGNSEVSGAIYLTSMFENCHNLQSVPKITNIRPSKLDYLFRYCTNLRNLPEDMEDWFDWSYLDSATSTSAGSAIYMFTGCNSLRSIPMGFLKHQNPKAKNNYSYYYYGFKDCYVLDELIGLPVPYTGAWTSNAFNSCFQNCHRLKNLTFATQADGSPIVVQWAYQTIELRDYVGYAPEASWIIDFNSGITADKEFADYYKDGALYNDPDWFTCNIAFSRYTHDSAVATINSLPDASEYVASKGAAAINTIAFKGSSGLSMPGGAINTLTEEEIAVAAAKGWTVTISA